ncbi:MAG: hypothetical protein WED34_15955 [Planctomycetales bacterium]
MSARPGAARSSSGRLESLPHPAGRIANPSYGAPGTKRLALAEAGVRLDRSRGRASGSGPGRRPGPTFALLIAAGIASASAAASAPPEPPPLPRATLPFTISKETTHITEPLRPDGTPDYAAALEAIASAGVTPENNAAVLYWRALGPKEIDVEHRERFFGKLGIDVPPEEGDYLVDLGTVLRDLRRKERGVKVLDPAAFAEKDQRELDKLYERMDHIEKSPWSAAKEPVFAEWVRRNEKPLALIVEGTRRRKYYQPLYLPSENKAGSLIEVLLPGAQVARGAARLLVIRAMSHLGEGNVEQARSDLLACHRLARHVASGTFLIESLVGLAIENQALEGTAALARHAGLTAEQAHRYRERLAELPPLAPVSDVLDRGERYGFLDIVSYAALGGDVGQLIAYITLLGMSSPSPAFRIPESVERLGRQVATMSIEWDVPLKRGNEYFDRVVKAARAPTSSERRRRFKELGDRLSTDSHRAKNSGWIAARAYVSPNLRWTNSEQAATLMVDQFGAAIGAVSFLADRVAMQADLTQLAFALAAYRAERGEYPAELAQLAPRYIPAVPKDLFNDQPLKYLRANDRYLLYSVGPNGEDDEARTYDSEPYGDDIVIVSPKPAP